MTGAAPVSGDVVEPLEECARSQWETAQRLCAEECRWYHGPRLYLRAAGLIHGVRADGRFLLETFAGLAATRQHTRALISGAADFGTLAYLAAGFRAAGRTLQVTLVDKCATPLRMNAWLAEREGVPIETVQGDILTFDPAHAFDLICTHAFLGRFDPAGRRRVIGRWHDLLAPGGVVVTAHRLRESSPPREIPVASTDGEWIRQRARRVLARLDRIGDADQAQLLAWIDEFLDRKTTYPISSATEERAVFEDAGFDPVIFTRQDSTEVHGTLANRTPRMGVVAHRPL
jgi:SAM-dependent methyltransferase